MVAHDGHHSERRSPDARPFDERSVDADEFELENAVETMFRFHGYAVDPLHREEDLFEVRRRICYFRARKGSMEYVVGYTFGSGDVTEDEMLRFIEKFRTWDPAINRMYMSNHDFHEDAQEAAQRSHLLLWRREDLIGELGKFLVKKYEREHALARSKQRTSASVSSSVKQAHPRSDPRRDPSVTGTRIRPVSEAPREVRTQREVRSRGTVQWHTGEQVRSGEQMRTGEQVRTSEPVHLGKERQTPDTIYHEETRAAHTAPIPSEQGSEQESSGFSAFFAPDPEESPPPVQQFSNAYPADSGVTPVTIPSVQYEEPRAEPVCEVRAEPIPMSFEELEQMNICFDEVVAGPEEAAAESSSLTSHGQPAVIPSVPVVTDDLAGQHECLPSINWTVPNRFFLPQKHSLEFIERILTTRSPVSDPRLHYIPHFIYEMTLAGEENNGSARFITVDSVSGKASIWDPIPETLEFPESGSVTIPPVVDSRTAFTSAGKVAMDMFREHCRSLPGEAVKAVGFDPNIPHPLEELMNSRLLRVVSRGLFHRPVWSFSSETGRIMVDSLDLSITKLSA